MHPAPAVGRDHGFGRTLGAPAVAAGDIGSTLGGHPDAARRRRLAPQSPFNRPVGPNRRFAMVEAPVQTFKDIKNALGGTVNDVVLATAAGGVHHLFVERGLATKGRVQRAMVPVSVRADHERAALGNRVSSIFVDLPVGPMGAKGRLRHITKETSYLKDSNEAVGAEFLMNIGSWAPPTIHAMAARRRPGRGSSTSWSRTCRARRSRCTSAGAKLLASTRSCRSRRTWACRSP